MNRSKVFTLIQNLLFLCGIVRTYQDSSKRVTFISQAKNVKIVAKFFASKAIRGPFGLQQENDCCYYIKLSDKATLSPIINCEYKISFEIHLVEWPAYSCSTVTDIVCETVNRQQNNMDCINRAHIQASPHLQLIQKLKYWRKSDVFKCPHTSAGRSVNDNIISMTSLLYIWCLDCSSSFVLCY